MQDDAAATAERQGQPIAMLVNILSSGGAQRRIASLANRFVELGRTVDVISLDADGPMRAMLVPGIRIISFAAPERRRFSSLAPPVGALSRYLERTAPSVLMSCVTDTHALAVAAARANADRVPVVLRASRDPYRSLDRGQLIRRMLEPIKRRRAARVYARADAIVALSGAGHDALALLLGGLAPPMETILNPVVATALLDDAGARARRMLNSPPLVLGVGRLVKQKDFGTLLRAFAILRAERPAKLVLLGEGAERDALEALARKLNITSDVALPGEVGDVGAWMRRADLVVSSSRWEGLQATLIEALAVGCPVVATDCPGGARETLEEGRIGPLVPVRDAARMAIAMRGQLDHPPDPLLLAGAAARFTFAGKAEAYLALFDRCRRG